MLVTALSLAFFLNASEDYYDERSVVIILNVVAQLIGWRWLHKPLLVLCLVMQLEGYPYFANHSVLLVLFIVWVSLGGAEELPSIMGTVYFMAGFHKLNSGFFDPMAGCASDFATRFLREISSMGGHNAAPKSARLLPIAQEILPEEFLLFLAVSAVAVELIIGFIVVVSPSRLWQRRALLVVFAILHCPTCIISFFDFGSVAACALMALSPEEVAWRRHYASLFRSSGSSKGKKKKDDDHPEEEGKESIFAKAKHFIYLWLQEPALRDEYDPGGAAYRRQFFWWNVVPNMAVSILPRKFLAVRGVVWLVIACVFLVPLVKRRELDSKLPPRTLWRHLVSVGIIGVYCAGPYIGLHTAGAFTMFSNLRINPDGSSNHWLIPRTVQGLQSDVLRVTRIEPPSQPRVRKLSVGQVMPRWQIEMSLARAIARRPDLKPVIKAQEPVKMGPEPVFHGGAVVKVSPARWWQKLMPFQFRPGPYHPGCTW